MTGNRRPAVSTWFTWTIVVLGACLLAVAAYLQFAPTATPAAEADPDNHVQRTTQDEKLAPAPEKTYDGTTCRAEHTKPAKLDPGTWSVPATKLTAPWHTDTHGTSPQLPDAPEGIRYQPSMPLNATRGATVLAGHVDHAPGALSAAGGELSPWGHLHEVKPCQRLDVADETGTTRSYVVTGLTTVPQHELTPSDGEPSPWAKKLFRADGPRTLYLVTCSGPSVADAGGAFQFHYANNLIVTAVPAVTS